jgi:hypothetical protein
LPLFTYYAEGNPDLPVQSWATHAPGLVFAPSTISRVLATIGVVGFALVILLAVLPGPRRAYS